MIVKGWEEKEKKKRVINIYLEDWMLMKYVNFIILEKVNLTCFFYLGGLIRN